MRALWLGVPAISMAMAGAAGCDGLGYQLDCTEEADLCVDGGPDGAVIPPACDLTKSVKDSTACIDDGVGVFVSPGGDDGAAGTKAAPVRTIAKGIERAGARGVPRVYVCEGSYDGSVALERAVSLHGGLACSWEYTGAKPRIAPARGVALRVQGVRAALVLEDLEVVGSADENTPGDSAIAAFIADADDVTLRRVALNAGPAAAGAKGASRSNYSDPAADGGNASGSVAGVGATCTCDNGNSSKGGNGAAGNGAGIERGSAVPAVGAANAGTIGLDSCTAGVIGANGLAAAGGAGATSSGTLSAAGWEASALGTRGEDGAPAQGGGGGGARTDISAGGGGGACGGCGGAGGEAGPSGGSSFALLSFNASIAIEASTLASGPGGRGGDGGDGQAGQAGGASGAGVCSGGPGGNGAGGSGGGGGAGGHSAAIAFVGPAPRVIDSPLTSGARGAGGNGGAQGASAGNAGTEGAEGSPGTSQETLPL